MRREVPVFLGIWHNYKQVTKDIFLHFQDFLIAPWFHYLFPRREFYTPPKLVTMAYYLSILRLAYAPV